MTAFEAEPFRGYWADGFDWDAQELWLSGFRHFRAAINGDIATFFRDLDAAASR